MVIRTLAYYYDAAPAATRKAGARWYAEARSVARQYAKRYGVTLAQVVGVIAVLSQRQRWQMNLRLTRDCLRGERVPGVFAHMRAKAKRILAGDAPLDILRGPKIRAFYQAILGDADAVVLDTWMLVAMGRPQGVTVKQYERLADRLRAHAADAGVTPAAFQAVVWCQVRGGWS